MKSLLAAALLIGLAGCESEDEARLKRRRYELDVELTHHQNIAADLKTARSELERAQRVLAGIDSDYSIGALIAAMDASTQVKVSQTKPPVPQGEFILTRFFRITAPHNLEAELLRLADSDFPAFQLERIEWSKESMTLELSAPVPRVVLPALAPKSWSAAPSGHWWDGSQQLRAECEDFAVKLATVRARLADAGAPLIREELEAYKKLAEDLRLIDTQLRRAPRIVPKEMALLMSTIPLGTWEVRSGKAWGSGNGGKAAYDQLVRTVEGSLPPSVEVSGDSVSWSYAPF